MYLFHPPNSRRVRVTVTPLEQDIDHSEGPYDIDKRAPLGELSDSAREATNTESVFGGEHRGPTEGEDRFQDGYDKWEDDHYIYRDARYLISTMRS